MYIIDNIYFKIGKLLIPNINNNTSTATADKVEVYIDSMSRLVFKTALGKLYTEFDSHVTDGVLDIGAPIKWQNLVNGTTYTYKGNDYIWEGMIQEEGTSKTSLLADYTFYRYLSDNTTIPTESGNAVLNVKNSNIVSSDDKLRDVWNDFVDAYRGDIDDCYRYDNYNNRIYSNESNYVSLITFLEHNSSDYEDAGKSLIIDKRRIERRNWAGL